MAAVHFAMFGWWLTQKPLTTGQLTKLAVLLVHNCELEDFEKAEIASKIRKEEAFGSGSRDGAGGTKSPVILARRGSRLAPRLADPQAPQKRSGPQREPRRHEPAQGAGED